MADYRKIVDEIEAFLSSPDQTEDDVVKELASQYAELCKEVNRRLRSCGELLQQGLRSQAIELAEIEPDLLDLVSLIDFPDRFEWEEIAASYGWQRSYGLKTDVAEQLGAAYNDEDRLRPLMTKHRKLALERAPLNERIDVMRKIRELDNISPFWTDDIHEFERVRIKQLLDAARQAQQSSDYDLMEKVRREVETTPWEVQLSRRDKTEFSALVPLIIDELTLPVLTSQLVKAFRDADIERARRLRDQWQTACSKAADADTQWQPSIEITNKCDEVFEWLAQEDQFGSSGNLMSVVVFSQGIGVENVGFLESQHGCLEFTLSAIAILG